MHIVVGAAVGGLFNLGVKAYQGKIHDFQDGLAAFGIGAVAGAVGAATGGAAFIAAGGAAGGIGGFAVGAGAGAIGTAYSAPIQSIGNSIYFQDPTLTQKDYLFQIVGGAAFGGVFNGGLALYNGRNFFTGELKQIPIPKVQINQVPVNTPYAKGQEGLHLNNIEQNTIPIKSYTGTAKYRVPDEMITDDMRNIIQIGEVKNYSVGRTVNYTSQIRDYILFSENQRVFFKLYVPMGVRISAPLQNAINNAPLTTIVYY